MDDDNNDSLSNEIKEEPKQIQMISIKVPNEFMKITCGKILIPSKPSTDSEKQESQNTKQTNTFSKYIPQESFDKMTYVMAKQLRSEFNQRNITLYLYFLLLAIDDTAQITINRNARDVEQNPSLFKTYRCESIISNKQIVYQRKQHYKTCIDQLHQCNTIEFDETISYPKIDEKNKCSYSSKQANRIQQHILIQIINKYLKQNNEEIQYYVKKTSKTNFLATIQFDEYFDMNDEYYLEKKTKNNRNNQNEEDRETFKELSETILDILTYCIDKINGVTKQVIIGDLLTSSEDYIIDKDCSKIGRWKFFRLINEVRRKNR